MQGNITDWGKEVKKGLIERGWSIKIWLRESASQEPGYPEL